MTAYILLADGFEEVEALTPYDILKRAGIDVFTASIKDEPTVTGTHGVTVTADLMAKDVDPTDVSLIVFPGGMPGAENLHRSPLTDKFIDAALANGAHLAAICAAPIILGRRGLLNDKYACCYPGFEDDLEGAYIYDDPVLTDGNITTSRGMGTAMLFALELVRVLKDKDCVLKIRKSICMPEICEYRSCDVAEPGNGYSEDGYYESDTFKNLDLNTLLSVMLGEISEDDLEVETLIAPTDDDGEYSDDEE